MSETFRFEIYTPYRLFYTGEVQGLTLTLIDGEIGIYAHHSPFVAPFITSVLRIKNAKGDWEAAFISDGIIEVKKTKTILLADSANWPNEIDIDRVLIAQKKAEAVLKEESFKFEITQAKKDLLRATVRRQVHEMSLPGS
ncbi:MAG: ATP synthase F1 subunit epsilon [Spirochaetaceae bacterium]|jgi:F-type H+-transporting ATPase subunit epsilon|nr:ATP synthase F1 subunit epsilon [Spirochaetaceae bacterium]